MESVTESTEPSQEENVRKCSRERRMTEKGLDYRKQLLERDRNSALKIRRDQIQTASSLVSTSDDVRVLQREVFKLETRMEDLTKVSHKLNDLQNPEERSKDMEVITECGYTKTWKLPEA